MCAHIMCKWACIGTRTGESIMNITLSAEEELIRRAREVARAQGKSLNEVIREYLRALTRQTGAQPAEELFDLMDEAGGDLRGQRVSREELYER